jgi:hypothetical protein
MRRLLFLLLRELGLYQRNCGRLLAGQMSVGCVVEYDDESASVSHQPLWFGGEWVLQGWGCQVVGRLVANDEDCQRRLMGEVDWTTRARIQEQIAAAAAAGGAVEGALSWTGRKSRGYRQALPWWKEARRE